MKAISHLLVELQFGILLILLEELRDARKLSGLNRYPDFCSGCIDFRIMAEKKSSKENIEKSRGKFPF
jgi:hypothetical protein